MRNMVNETKDKKTTEKNKPRAAKPAVAKKTPAKEAKKAEPAVVVEPAKKEAPVVKETAKAETGIMPQEVLEEVFVQEINEKGGKRYYEAVGRRKTAVARVRLFTCRPFEGEEGKIIVNGRPYLKYFSTLELRQTAEDPLKKMKLFNRFEVEVKVAGGGIKGQAEAVRHGLSRALVKFNVDFCKKLRRAGFLTRDSRAVERKKPGLKKARKAAQWRKR